VVGVVVFGVVVVVVVIVEVEVEVIGVIYTSGLKK
jgi:hypothetical protein